MYRGSGQAARDYPTSPKLLQRRTPPGSSARRLFSPRARLHPVVLVPVFLCGLLVAPWISAHLFDHHDRLPDPVYNPQEYRWTPDSFQPPDAPPLVPDDDGDDPGRAAPGPGAAARRAVAEAAAAHRRDDQAWEWWEPPARDPDAADSTSLADLTSSLYTVHAGLVYFRTSPSLIPPATLSKPFPVAPATRPGARAPPPRPAQPDQGLSLPPHAPKDWLLPGELFSHSPGHRRHAISPATGAEALHAPPVALRAPLPAAGARQPRQAALAAAAVARGGIGAAGARERAAAIRERADPGRSRGKPERDAQGRVIGANAAAAARALKADMPFIPGKPRDLLEAEKRLHGERDRARAVADEERRKKAAAQGAGAGAAGAAQGPMHVELDGHAVLDDDDDDDDADAMWRGGGLGRGAAAHGHDHDAEDVLASELDGAADDEADDDEAADDAALLEAVRALDPDEFALLTDAERALVADLEAKHAARQAAAPHAPAGGDAAAAAPPKPARRGPANARPAPRDPEALKRAQALREERRLNPPRRPLPKPVFRGQAGAEADKARREADLAKAAAGRARAGGRGLVKRASVVEGESYGDSELEDEAPQMRKLRKRAVVEDDAPPSEAPRESSESAALAASAPASSSASPSASEHSMVADDVATASPSPNLARRSLPDDAAAATLPDRLHPISHLVERAEQEWDDMLRRQSQTLEAAVAEYRRRYGKNPPVGFDSWWRYAMQNHVILVDEYDQVHEDILPFLSLVPTEFRRRVKSLTADQALPWFKQSFELKVRDGTAATGQGAGEAPERRDSVLDLLAEFVDMLPDLELRVAKGDEPSVVVSGEARERHERLGRDGKLLDLSSSFEIAEPTGFAPRDSLCAPNSTARRVAQGLAVDAPSRGGIASLRSFVSVEHVQAMNLCEHPEVRDLNGFTAWSGPRPYLLYPLFSSTKTSTHADLLLPLAAPDFYDEVGRDPVWEQKKHNKVLWRGETTGTYHSKGSGWRQSQRARLVALANADAGDSTLHLADSTSDALRLLTAPARDVSHHLFDVAYTGSAKQCSTKDTTCKLIQHEYRFDQWLSADEENKFKYVLDVDANYASGKFKRLMSSRSLVFKSTIFPEWWSKRVMPWYHYIPIQSDYSDLADVAAFFIGAPDGTGSHDTLAKRIGQQGKQWSEQHYREVDMAAYAFRLLLEYARLLHREDDDLQSMDYTL